MIDEDSASDTGGGVNIDREHFGDPVLQKHGHQFAILVPQPVGKSPCSERMNAFHEQQRDQRAVDRRVSFTDGKNICADAFDDFGVIRHRTLHDLPQLHRRERVRRKFAGEVIADRVLQTVVVQNGGIQKACQQWFGGGAFFSTVSHRRPKAGLIVSG